MTTNAITYIIGWDLYTISVCRQGIFSVNEFLSTTPSSEITWPGIQMQVCYACIGIFRWNMSGCYHKDMISRITRYINFGVMFSHFPPSCCFQNVSALSKHTLEIEYNVYIWQVLLAPVKIKWDSNNLRGPFARSKTCLWRVYQPVFSNPTPEHRC